jgi:hypothetical protein
MYDGLDIIVVVYLYEILCTKRKFLTELYIKFFNLNLTITRSIYNFTSGESRITKYTAS